MREAVPTTCPKDNTPLREDTEFLRAARLERVEVRRFVCVGGHSLYVGPAVESRGWTPRPDGPRPCACGAVLPGVGKRAHGVGVRRCRACRGLSATCTACGAPLGMADTRKTCSDACLHAVAAATGRLALAKLHETQAS